jgi:predicted DsbA family dithiol-disulfide isomerase
MLASSGSYPTAALVLILVGLLAAVLAILEGRVEWIARICSVFGEGCRRTATFRLFGLPIPWWGILYYLGLGVVLFLFRPLMFWAVMAGFGIEATFLTIMVLIRVLCVFCLLNSFIMTLLLVVTFDIHRAPQAVVTILLAYGIAGTLLYKQNQEKLRRPPRDEVLGAIEGEAAAGRNSAWGPRDAPLTVIEFSDYLCPFCRRGRKAVERIRREYKQRIRWIYMDFPLDMHPGAKELARAVRCAGEQGKFWKLQDLVFASEARPDRERLLEFARRLGLDPDRLGRCLDSSRHLDEIEEDIVCGTEAGVGAAPTILVNGNPLVAPSYGDLRRAIDDGLKTAAARRPKGD